MTHGVERQKWGGCSEGSLPGFLVWPEWYLLELGTGIQWQVGELRGMVCGVHRCGPGREGGFSWYSITMLRMRLRVWVWGSEIAEKVSQTHISTQERSIRKTPSLSPTWGNVFLWMDFMIHKHLPTLIFISTRSTSAFRGPSSYTTMGEGPANNIIPSLPTMSRNLVIRMRKDGNSIGNWAVRLLRENDA